VGLREDGGPTAIEGDGGEENKLGMCEREGPPRDGCYLSFAGSL